MRGTDHVTWVDFGSARHGLVNLQVWVRLLVYFNRRERLIFLVNLSEYSVKGW